MIALFDSNIVIDYLNGFPEAAHELAQYRRAYISPITWVEAQVKCPPGLEDATRAAVAANFTCVELNEATLQESLALRRSHKLKLPDAMIWACARVNGWQLVTRNTKDFPPTLAGVRLPYTLPVVH
jgi:predicted nucleic acid-binding protein